MIAASNLIMVYQNDTIAQTRNSVTSQNKGSSHAENSLCRDRSRLDFKEAFIPSVANTGNSKVTAIISGDTKKARTLADFHDIEHVYHYDALETALLDDVF